MEDLTKEQQIEMLYFIRKANANIMLTIDDMITKDAINFRTLENIMDNIDAAMDCFSNIVDEKDKTNDIKSVYENPNSPQFVG